MKKLTKAKLPKCCSTKPTKEKAAQCCAKASRLIAGCHD